jgi:hypothetical protein
MTETLVRYIDYLSKFSASASKPQSTGYSKLQAIFWTGRSSNMSNNHKDNYGLVESRKSAGEAI